MPAELNVQLIAHTAFTPPVNSDGDYIFTPDQDNYLGIAGGEVFYDGLALAEHSGRSCYQSFDRPNPATATNKGYLANILNQKHHSVLEHGMVSLSVEGVSRSLTHELVRHRHFSFSQLSQRYVDSSDVDYVVPPALDHPDFLPDLEYTMRTAKSLYEDFTARLMARGLSRKKAREAARGVLPGMVETKLVVTGNYRAWIEFLIKRDSPAADAEMQRFARRVGVLLGEHAPAVFGVEARGLWDGSAAQGVADTHVEVEPRTWVDDDPEPNDVEWVTDGDGDYFHREGARWRFLNDNGKFYGRAWKWDAIVTPITEAAAPDGFTPEPAGPRVFNVGDPEPEDLHTITLETVGNPSTRNSGKRVVLKYGRFGPGQWLGWWHVNQDYPTHGSWDYWLNNYRVLTEVVEQDAPEPEPEPESESRVFDRGDVIPDDVETVRTARNQVLSRKWGTGECGGFGMNVGWGRSDTSKLGWYEDDFPLTEVVDREVPETPEPRVFTGLTEVPEDILVLKELPGEGEPDDYYVKRAPGGWRWVLTPDESTENSRGWQPVGLSKVRFVEVVQ